MGRLGPLTSLALGRSPYDDVVPGEGPEDPRGRQQQYDERGRLINLESKRINRDIIRSHNEVMMVIGVAEPENGIAEARAEAARKHFQYEDRIGRRLLRAGGVLETVAVWGVNGMRQRILLYKPYSQTTFYGMFQLAWTQHSLASDLFAGLPSFVASTIVDQLVVPRVRKDSLIRHAILYIRLHLSIFTFFQRSRIFPFNQLLPSWRFFIPGTSVSPIPLPPIPTSFRPQGLLQWMGAFALGVMPFVAFCQYQHVYSAFVRSFRIVILHFLPRPSNANKRRVLREAAPLPPGADSPPTEIRTEESPRTRESEPLPDAPLRRQSTFSHRGSTSSQSAPRPGQPDNFASDDEEEEVIGSTLISFDVEASDSTPDRNSAATNSNADATTTASAAGVWSAELRPNLLDSSGGRPAGSGGQHEPVYRETALTRLPAMLAAEMLALIPARLLLAPFASLVWTRLARSYMARQGMSLDGVWSGAGLWWGMHSTRGLVNLLGLELLFAVLQGEAWAMVMLVAEMFRYSEDEWNEREGVSQAVAEEEDGTQG
ncbi:hypothetical protein C8A03DRAFT_13972 [Achaetomium macrosporum]|uniref:Uncharacterized protein n=1 Tax=Achaetomium macrosporum TaxID=79813 RepID=A0AAN7CDQ2_9PEZI|nr:hypothetical protein C8A03DRAFT_13972 [Achaetomium macrosporum]